MEIKILVGIVLLFQFCTKYFCTHLYVNEVKLCCWTYGDFIVFCLLSIDNNLILDFKLSPCYECCILSFGWLPSNWILCDNASEHCLFHLHRSWQTMKMEHTECSKMSAHKIQMLGNHAKDRTQQHSYCYQSTITNWCTRELLLKEY
jgi:hypothetical protein